MEIITSKRWPAQEVDEYIDRLKEAMEGAEMVAIRSRNGKAKAQYYNVGASFDIETTSFFVDDQPRAIMYIWMVNIYGLTIFGRTWDEFTGVMDRVRDALGLGKKNMLVLYVHNLAFEWEFVKSLSNLRIEPDTVFALSATCPIRFRADGFEFRCSYKLSGKSLNKTADDIQNYKVRKMVGDLDYDLKRHSATELTMKELGYCFGDVEVTTAYIQDKIDRGEDIISIPMTATGYIRQMVRERCFDPNDRAAFYRYRDLIRSLTIGPDGPEWEISSPHQRMKEFNLLKWAFRGGFTHANNKWVGKTCEHIASADVTSEYPTVMVAEQYPMGKGEEISPDTIKSKTVRQTDAIDVNDPEYCYLMQVVLFDMRERVSFEHMWSASACVFAGRKLLDNGRVVMADAIEFACTEQDLEVLRMYYTWKSDEVVAIYRYRKDYLPKPIIECILELYEAKTTLKNVPGREMEYAWKKALLNSIYGMVVTAIDKPEHSFDPESGELMKVQRFDETEFLERYNKSRKRFLFYPWGVWVTAYGRKIVARAIWESGEDHRYTDTDSEKFANFDAHAWWYEEFNQEIKDKTEACLAYHGIDPARLSPADIDGVAHPLGYWDFDPEYQRFKTLGAKRYLVEKYDKKGNLKIEATVAGCSKKGLTKYLNMMKKESPRTDRQAKKWKRRPGVDPFDAFTYDLVVPAAYSGRQVHYRTSFEAGELVDYQGVKNGYGAGSGLCIKPEAYHMSLGEEFAEYLAMTGNGQKGARV